jgi:predicted secreted protein
LDQRSISLKVGETQTLNLGGSGPTGYVWQIASEGDRSVVKVRIEGAGEPPSPSPGTVPRTSTVDQLLVVEGLAVGKTKVRVMFCRPWESKPPAKEEVIEISVNS